MCLLFWLFLVVLTYTMFYFVSCLCSSTNYLVRSSRRPPVALGSFLQAVSRTRTLNKNTKEVNLTQFAPTSSCGNSLFPHTFFDFSEPLSCPSNCPMFQILLPFPVPICISLTPFLLLYISNLAPTCTLIYKLFPKI